MHGNATMQDYAIGEDVLKGCAIIDPEYIRKDPDVVNDDFVKFEANYLNIDIEHSNFANGQCEEDNDAEMEHHDEASNDRLLSC